MCNKMKTITDIEEKEINEELRTDVFFNDDSPNSTTDSAY